MRRAVLLLCCAVLGSALQLLHAQVESPVLIFNRGQLWQSVFFGKSGPGFANWGRRGVGLDWPGFDATWVREDIGGPPSHLLTGGFIIGARKRGDTVLTVEDWSIVVGTVSSDPNAKYIVTQHTKRWKNGENFWLRANPLVGEEIVETTWEYNFNYTNVDDRERQLPMRISRTMHQWSGSRREENYIIHEYVFRNISPELRARGRVVPDTLYGVYLMATYALHSNSRSWTVLFPSLTPGARNTWFFWDNPRKMIWARAGNYRDTPGQDESFGRTNSLGLIINGKPRGEWLAPGFVGLRLLYSTPDTTGQPSRVNGYGWSAASNSVDLSGPLTGAGTNEAKYQIVARPANAASFVASSADTVYMQRSRMWSLMSLGPWTILPGDSVVVAFAEMVDGLDYKYAVDTATTSNKLGVEGSAIFFRTAEKAQITYNQRRAGRGYNHPDPPAAPRFTVDYFRGRERFVANQISWAPETEGLRDPDDNTDDLAGYKVYRSGFLPIGPWDSVAVVPRGDLRYFDATSNRYTLVDSSVQIGTLYYYAVTAYDTGKASWPVDPTVRFPETGNSTRVPPLESSIFAARTIVPFRATIPPISGAGEVLVVPNPFVIREGFSQPGEADAIQFVNLPNPCTIRIYTVRGDLVATIDVPDGAGGIAAWDQVTDYGQFVESGVYIFHVDSPSGTKVGKFAIIR